MEAGVADSRQPTRWYKSGFRRSKGERETDRGDALHGKCPAAGRVRGRQARSHACSVLGRLSQGSGVRGKQRPLIALPQQENVKGLFGFWKRAARTSCVKIAISAVGPDGPGRRSVKHAAKNRCMGSGSIAPEVTSLTSPCGGYRVQRVQTEKVKAVLSALDACSLTVLAFSVEDGVQRQHDRFLIQTAITS